MACILMGRLVHCTYQSYCKLEVSHTVASGIYSIFPFSVSMKLGNNIVFPLIGVSYFVCFVLQVLRLAPTFYLSTLQLAALCCVQEWGEYVVSALVV